MRLRDPQHVNIRREDQEDHDCHGDSDSYHDCHGHLVVLLQHKYSLPRLNYNVSSVYNVRSEDNPPQKFKRKPPRCEERLLR